MAICDHCRQEIEELRHSRIGIGESLKAASQHAPGSFILFDGDVCQPCFDSLVTGIREWCAKAPPRPETPEHLPEPKQAYVLKPRETWHPAVCFIALVLAHLLAAVAGAAGMAFLLKH